MKGKTYAKPVVKEKEGAKDLVAALKASLEKTKKMKVGMIHVSIVLSDLPNNRIGPIRPKVTKKLKTTTI